MLVAFCDQVFGNSTPRCSKAGLSGSPMTASRSSHSTSSKGWTPGVVWRRSTVSPASVGSCACLQRFYSSSPLLDGSSLGVTADPRARPGRNHSPRRGRLLAKLRATGVGQGPEELQVGARGRAPRAPSGRARRSARPRARRQSAAIATSIRSTIVSTSAAVTGRLWAARSSAARSLVRSKRWRLAVALDHVGRLGVAPLEGGEALAALRALAAAPHDVPVGRAAALQDAGRSAARGTIHAIDSTSGSGFLPRLRRYM